jgi:hypothetical protein
MMNTGSKRLADAGRCPICNADLKATTLCELLIQIVTSRALALGSFTKTASRSSDDFKNKWAAVARSTSSYYGVGSRASVSVSL